MMGIGPCSPNYFIFLAGGGGKIILKSPFSSYFSFLYASVEDLTVMLPHCLKRLPKFGAPDCQKNASSVLIQDTNIKSTDACTIKSRYLW